VIGSRIGRGVARRADGVIARLNVPVAASSAGGVIERRIVGVVTGRPQVSARRLAEVDGEATRDISSDYLNFKDTRFSKSYADRPALG
jgi:hypothetical protein